MGEIKSVKVDNWGAFFLQKLQNFFNKTDYCDLTLQFNDNSQLKVHKLVLSACTDYFNVLEQTCEMIDDILIMPNELQADLVVPIVNFMYTGTLEFELKMYGKLLKTARDMNMTVLLKLLEAHRRTMESGTKQIIRNTKTSPNQNYLNVNLKPTASLPANIDTSLGNKRRQQSTKIEPYRKLQIKPMSSNTVLTKYSNTKITPVKGPSRFEYEGENTLQDPFEPSFDAISYESKPLKQENNDEVNQQQESVTSLQFEQLRRTGYNNNKRPAESNIQSPPTKKPNIQDVKEYAEQQRMRKQIAEEYGEEFEDTLDDEFHNADDDEEYIPTPIHPQTTPKILPTSTNNLKQNTAQQHQNYKKSTVNVGAKQEEKPRIVVKDSTASNVDHAKIISEVLRKYPHLIKNNKNIKLKIVPNASGNGGPQRVVIKKEQDTNISPVPSTSKSALSGTQDTKILKVPPLNQQKVSPPSVSTSKSVSQPSQPRRIDSKIMKALISLGAENTTGPWLCLRCGVNGRPISIPSYRGFRRHLINAHREKIDSRLCEHCGWRSKTNKELLFHMHVEHQIKCNISFPKCEHCSIFLLDLAALNDHIDEYHPESKEENQQCIYCNKTFAAEILLYNHMKAQHKERAKEDGVIDFSDDDEHIEEFTDDNIDNKNCDQGKKPKPSTSSKIQILSDINLSKCISLTKTPLETENLVNDDYVTTSSTLDGTDKGPKFVNAEGNVMELTPAQRDEIISQLEQSDDGVVMVLNDEPFAKEQKNTDLAESSSSDKIQTISSQEFGNNNMLILYDQQEINEKNKEQKIDKTEITNDEIKEKIDTCQEDTEAEEVLKKSEIVTAMKEEIVQKEEINEITNIKKDDKDSSDLDMKLKLLTGDWTEDEDEECTNEHEKESKTDSKIENDKILDILGKSDSSDIADTNTKMEMKEENECDTNIIVENECEEKNENHSISDAPTKETDALKDDEDVAADKNNETEESFESYSENNDKYEEVLLSTVTEDSFIKETEEEGLEKTEEDNKIIKIADSNTQDNNDDNEIKKNILDKNDEKELIKNEDENISEKINIDKEDVDVDVDDDDNSKKHSEIESSALDDQKEEEQLEDDKFLNKSDNVEANEQIKSINKNKDESDTSYQKKTKEEIKNLISDWGDDDDDL